LLVLLAVLGLIWVYQNNAAPSVSRREAFAPQSASRLSGAAGAPDQSVDTSVLRGYRGEWYQVYFTKPPYPETSDRRGGLDATLVADLDTATQRIEVASFDFDLPNIAAALIRARERGVAVRLAVDGENLEAPQVAKLTGDLQAAGIPVFFDQRAAFMHNKFVVIDNATVWTGSANLTVNDVFRNNNNMLRIVDQRLAENYTRKADDIFNGGGGPDRLSVLVYPELPIGAALVRTSFAPDNATTDGIVQAVQDARQQIDLLAFAFTSQPLAEAVIEAQQRGVVVRAVMETRNTKGTGSVFGTLRGAGIDIHSDGNCYIMHHKVMIIDGRTVITGSFNFTRAAEAQNDENLLVITDASLAARYTEEFERIYQQAIHPPRCG
jgi:phosphatidylserine/phosphatidylglycerophosphate/cardiolipin synthase-like enzyme